MTTPSTRSRESAECHCNLLHIHSNDKHPLKYGISSLFSLFFFVVIPLDSHSPFLGFFSVIFLFSYFIHSERKYANFVKEERKKKRKKRARSRSRRPKRKEKKEEVRNRGHPLPSATCIFVVIVVVALFVQHEIILGRICALKRELHALASTQRSTPLSTKKYTRIVLV